MKRNREEGRGGEEGGGGEASKPSDSRGGKRSKKQYLNKRQAGGGGIEKRQFEAKDGFKGVLVTCAGKHKEGQTVRELFNLFNEYAESMYPPENAAKPQSDESLSIEDALAQEIAGIKKESQEGQRKFYVLETNVKGLIFIRFTDPRMQPVPFVTHILEDLAATKQQKTKNAVRMLPIQKTCAVQLDKVLELIDELARPYFPPNPPPGQKKPFTVLFKRRNNDRVRQMDTIEATSKLLGEVGILNYRHPEVTILVEIFQRACGVGVVPSEAYKRLCDFNLHRIYEGSHHDKSATASAHEEGNEEKQRGGDVPDQADPEEEEEEMESEKEDNADDPSFSAPSG